MPGPLRATAKLGGILVKKTRGELPAGFRSDEAAGGYRLASVPRLGARSVRNARAASDAHSISNCKHALAAASLLARGQGR